MIPGQRLEHRRAGRFVVKVCVELICLVALIVIKDVNLAILDTVTEGIIFVIHGF